MPSFVRLPALVAVLLATGVFAQEDLDKHIYPFAPPKAAPPVTIDVSAAPEAKAWAERAAKLAAAWFPEVTSLLATQDWEPPKEMKILVKEIDPPAYASGGTITVSRKWIAAHPDDFGMIIHEMVHVVQSYPGGDDQPGWLTEGIADYIRWYRFEPEAPRPRVDKEKSKYTDAYRTTAAFLAWVTHKYDHRFVPALDAKMRQGEKPLPEFERLAGKNVDELWTEFVQSL